MEAKKDATGLEDELEAQELGDGDLDDIAAGGPVVVYSRPDVG